MSYSMTQRSASDESQTSDISISSHHAPSTFCIVEVMINVHFVATA